MEARSSVIRPRAPAGERQAGREPIRSRAAYTVKFLDCSTLFRKLSFDIFLYSFDLYSNLNQRDNLFQRTVMFYNDIAFEYQYVLLVSAAK